MKRSIVSIVVVILSLFLMAGAAYAGDKRISSGTHFGCMSRDYFKKLVGYSARNDREAFSQGLNAGLLAEQCTMFKAGEKVFIADTAIFSGLVQVRRQGSIAEYWTNIEAVK